MNSEKGGSRKKTVRNRSRKWEEKKRKEEVGIEK